jgi:hypothetical protein
MAELVPPPGASASLNFRASNKNSCVTAQEFFPLIFAWPSPEYVFVKQVHECAAPLGHQAKRIFLLDGFQ